MVTIAFGFIVEHGAVEWRTLTGGQNGLMGIAQPSLPGVDGGERALALIAIAVLGLAVAAYARIARGSWGAAMRAVRDSETAAASIGVDPLVVKTVGFAFSAALAGLAGGLFAPLQGMVTPGMFSFLQSILFVLVVMIGGAGTVAGPLVGAGDRRPAARNAVEPGEPAAAVLRRVAAGGAVGGTDRHHRRGDGGAATAASGAAGRGRRGGRRHASVRDAAARRGLSASGCRWCLAACARWTTCRSIAAGTGDQPDRPNGAGKSTVLNMLSGYYRPRSGAQARRAGAAGAWRVIARGTAFRAPIRPRSCSPA
jgi:hypothetical protein